MFELVRHVLGWRKRRRHLQRIREAQRLESRKVVDLLRAADDDDQMKRPPVLERIRKPRRL